jgi:anaerobic selenocysteine-containing dehydrogenase
MGTTEVKSFCRICIGACGTVLTLDDSGGITAIRADKDHPASGGYVCVKGLQAPAAHNGPQRLLHPLKRGSDGSFGRIPLEQALDEIADRLRQIIERDGPDAVAAFRGTQSGLNSTAYFMLPEWLKAIGSPSFFSTMTVDQSAKWVTVERLGVWGAGHHPFHDSDVLMIFGANPLVSISCVGFDTINVARQTKEAKARGMKLIVIDPRLTETARHADLFLQPRPGEDPAIAAGLLRIILCEGWEDADFCARYVDNLEGLRRAVDPFTPDYVEQRAGLARGELRQAAELFAHSAKRGAAIAGTGPDMAAHSNLAEHLIECLNVVCGRYLRAGERVPNPGVLVPRRPRRARVIAPRRSWERGHKSRIRGVGMLFGEMMAGIMADEILQPGKGQIKALIVDGGNPVNSLPDQRKVTQALSSLELLVTIDPIMSNTARLSHYILPPRLQYERADLPTTRDYETLFFHVPFSQYTPGVAKPPPGSEVVDDWYVFWALARRLGRTIVYDGVPLDMTNPPTSEDLVAIVTRNSQVSLDEIRKYPGGKIFERELQYVEPANDSSGRFAVIPPDVADELAAVVAEGFAVSGMKSSGGVVFTHRLSARRMREVSNTTYQELPAIRRRRPYNPAWLNPRDLEQLGLTSGDKVEIVSDHGRITAFVQADETVRPGVVSMSHGWGPLPDDTDDGGTQGSPVNRLVSSERDVEAINAMPRQSAIPVNIVRVSI